MDQDLEKTRRINPELARILEENKKKAELLRERKIKEFGHFSCHAAPILNDLAKSGLDLESLEDLKLRRIDYRQQLAVLLNWIPRISHSGVKETVIRSLARKEAKPRAAPVLIKEFWADPTPVGERSRLRWPIGNSLDIVADDSVFDEMVEIANDRRFGADRQMVVRGLKNMKNPDAVQVLMQLLDDDTVAGHALGALRLMGATEARPSIEPFLTHEKTWWRNEAKNAIAKFERIEERTRD